MDFFVSYTHVDLHWARWIAWQLEEAGYQAFIQAWDIRPGNNFIVEMQRAAEESQRTLAVVSPDYLKSRFALPEWAAAVAKDPTGTDGVLLPVRISEVDFRGLLKAIVYIDLVGLSEEDARTALLDGVRQSRAKPADAPGFPGEGALPAPVPPYPAQPPATPDPVRDWELVDVDMTKEGNIALLLRPASSRMVTTAHGGLTVQALAALDRLVARLQQQGPNEVAVMRKDILQSLLPEHAWRRIEAADRVFFMTDVEAARYPWELLCTPTVENEEGAHDVQSSSVLRSFSALRSASAIRSDAPARLHSSHGDPRGGALVIASPRVSAAATEARTVAEQLSGGQAVIEQVVSDDARVIFDALFKRPYPIIHIIGRARLTAAEAGFCLGKDTYLGAAEMGAMRVLPELAFLHIELADKSDERPLEQARLAVAFAEELMKMGVRCVIAAGWEVSDREAQSFVREFYRLMTSGASLQVATQGARAATRRESRSSNAWASFFCFGYPDYRLPGIFERAN